MGRPSLSNPMPGMISLAVEARQVNALFARSSLVLPPASIAVGSTLMVALEGSLGGTIKADARLEIESSPIWGEAVKYAGFNVVFPKPWISPDTAKV